MFCPRCGCNHIGAVRICPGCGGDLRTLSRPSPDPHPFPVVAEQYAPLAVGVAPAMATAQYATLGERFLAFLCDACVESVLVAAILVVLYPRSSLSFQSLDELAAWIIPAAYMTLAEFLFHGTIGKRLLRIKLQVDTRVPEEQSFFRLLLREAIGKPLCSAILGIGFLAAVWNAKKKTNSQDCAAQRFTYGLSQQKPE